MRLDCLVLLPNRILLGSGKEKPSIFHLSSKTLCTVKWTKEKCTLTLEIDFRPFWYSKLAAIVIQYVPKTVSRAFGHSMVRKFAYFSLRQLIKYKFTISDREDRSYWPQRVRTLLHFYFYSPRFLSLFFSFQFMFVHPDRFSAFLFCKFKVANPLESYLIRRESVWVITPFDNYVMICRGA